MWWGEGVARRAREQTFPGEWVGFSREGLGTGGPQEGAVFEAGAGERVGDEGRMG